VVQGKDQAGDFFEHRSEPSDPQTAVQMKQKASKTKQHAVFLQSNDWPADQITTKHALSVFVFLLQRQMQFTNKIDFETLLPYFIICVISTFPFAYDV
jgi:hypothetical protein